MLTIWRKDAVMGYVRPGDRSFPGPSAKAAAGIAAASREHPAKGGAEMRSSSACFRGAFQQRHRAADGGVPSHRDCHASSLYTRWGGGHSSEAKTKAFAAGPNARLGTEDSGYDLEDQATRCDSLERADPGPASGCVSHVGARGMAAPRSATAPGREVQVVQRSTVRREGAGRGGPISEPAGPGFGAVRG